MPIIIETCPECGHDLIDIMIATNPPIPRKECTACNWSWEGSCEEIIRAPFQKVKPVSDEDNLSYTPISPASKAYTEFPCETCGNNSLNGGSGVCLCTLGVPGMRW